MCLILFAYHRHPKYKLIVAANRDEFYERQTLPIHYWEDRPNILAGRDLEKMGTWMGVTTSGRFAALTNYRNPKEKQEGKRSRGQIVREALEYAGNPKDYMEKLGLKDDRYPGYNLLVGDIENLYYYSNVGRKLKKLEPGIHGVSNHLLNTEWPKVQKGKEGMSKTIMTSGTNMVEDLFTLLEDDKIIPDELLPHTGISLEKERMLSPLFIKSEDYGTRSSTVMLMSGEEIYYTERIFSRNGVSEQEYTIKMER